jgi:hypothetical protein
MSSSDVTLQCTICAEDYDDCERTPLLFACCKGGECCRECLVNHISIGSAKCIICSKRPTRHFIRECENTTPTNFLDILIKKSKTDLESEPIRRTIALGEGNLMAEYITSREVKGDAEIAHQLSRQLSDQEAKKREAVEKADAEFAARMQEEEEKARIAQKDRLTKTADVSQIPKISSTSIQIHHDTNKKSGLHNRLHTNNAPITAQKDQSSTKVRGSTLDVFFAGCNETTITNNEKLENNDQKIHNLNESRNNHNQSSVCHAIKSPLTNKGLFWSCRACTSLNNPLLPHCEYCDTVRDHDNANNDTITISGAKRKNYNDDENTNIQSTIVVLD